MFYHTYLLFNNRLHPLQNLDDPPSSRIRNIRLPQRILPNIRRPPRLGLYLPCILRRIYRRLHSTVEVALVFAQVVRECRQGINKRS